VCAYECAKSENLREGERNKSYISMMKRANNKKAHLILAAGSRVGLTLRIKITECL